MYLVGTASQLTAFYMRGALPVKGLNTQGDTDAQNYLTGITQAQSRITQGLLKYRIVFEDTSQKTPCILAYFTQCHIFYKVLSQAVVSHLATQS